MYFGMNITFLSAIISLFKFSKNQNLAKEKDKNATIAYHVKEDLLFFENNSFIYLNHLEEVLLKYLINNIDYYIPLQNINSIIEKETKTYSINSIIRRREMTINMLKNILSLLLKIPYEEVIFEQKNKYDRRLKEIKLNNKYFKIID